jgi:hypothetical protein
MNDKNKLNVLYRICPKMSIRSPYFGTSKLTQTLKCLATFEVAFENIPHKTTFILDSCPGEYWDNIRLLVRTEKTMIEGEWKTDRGTFLKQVELACGLLDVELVYFAEDDYIYLPGAGEKLIAALGVYDFITPYDHPDYYREPNTNLEQHLSVVNNQHWVNRISTCHTFGTWAKNIKANKAIFEKYAPNDYAEWVDITKKYSLVSPVPSLATHLVNGLFAPVIQWPIKSII